MNDVFEVMHRVNVTSGIHDVFPSAATAYGDTIGFTSWGAMLVRTGPDAGPSSFFVWPLSGPPVLLATPPLPGSFVPGS